MAAFAHSVLFMMLAWTSVIALHSTSPKRTRAESVAEDKIHTMETEPSTHSGVDDAQWRQLHNLVDAKLTQMSNTMETQMTELRKEVKNEVAELSNDVAKLERGAILSHDVEANHKFCKIGHTDDYIHTYKTDRGYYSFKWIQKGLVNIQFAW
ncbi:hypothetical protein FOZ60_015915 [Perkinsus olseni]|nr:hypothetical protein FOZ60_015915 [Perkinsus olseni]